MKTIYDFHRKIMKNLRMVFIKKSCEIAPRCGLPDAHNRAGVAAVAEVRDGAGAILGGAQHDDRARRAGHARVEHLPPRRELLAALEPA